MQLNFCSNRQIETSKGTIGLMHPIILHMCLMTNLFFYYLDTEIWVLFGVLQITKAIFGSKVI
jgi:hypothetical protein